MEAWVRPTHLGTADEVSLIEQHSNDHGYTLALDKREQSAPAMRFDGLTYVEVKDSSALDILGDITLEAWVRPEALDHHRYVIGRGGDGEVLLRITKGSYELGSWDGEHPWETTVHKAIAKVPESDLGSWVHLAGVRHGGPG